MSQWFVDFETRSRVDLRKTGSSVYARHQSTEALCLAYAKDDNPVELWVAGQGCPAALSAAVESGETFNAHNAAFEIDIWNHVMAPLGWPVPRLEQWRCTAARVAALALPRDLASAAKALGLSVEKDDEGRRIMQQLCRPRQPTKNDSRPWFDEPEKFARLYAYCKKDVEVERAIHRATPALPDKEHTLWLLDQRINGRGVPVDLELVEAAIHLNQQHVHKLTAELTQLTEGAVTSGRQVKKMVDWLIAAGINLADVTKATVAKLLESGQVSGKPRRVLELRRLLSQASVAKYDAMRLRSDRTEDQPGVGRARGCHMYYGASRTGRWAGRGIQTQNITRGSIGEEEIEAAAALVKARDIDGVEMVYPEVPGLLSSLIRAAISAPSGRKLIVCDFASIEARVLAWLAGQQDVLGKFERGEDVYKSLAAKIFTVPYAEISKDQRGVGKVAVLGLGYQMGGVRFVGSCRERGISIEPEFAKQVVAVYRNSNSAIVRLWRGLQEAAIDVIDCKGSARVNRVTLSADDEYLRIRLPSGRSLFYREPELQTYDSPWGPRQRVSYLGVDSDTRKWGRQETYGGKLAENVTQAVARDLLAEAMTRLDAAGYEIVLHVHDEVVCECDETFGSAEAVRRIMCSTAGWADGCPIDAEGFETKRYRK